MATETYDVVVIGGGPAGENVADRAVRGGLSAVVVESELVGGECSYWACMPSKALLRPARAVRAAQGVAGAAAAVTGQLDVAAVLARRDEFAASWEDSGQVEWLASAGIDLVRGHGRITGVREVTVTSDDGTARTLSARHAVVISTGSDAMLPAIEGLAQAAPWTSREATSAAHVPDTLAVVGGGVVAVEMATAYAALGAEVTVLARHGLLGSMEPFVAEQVAAGLTAAGVDVRTSTQVRSVRRDSDGVHLDLTDGTAITTAEVLVATGRVPRTADLGLDAVGLTPGQPVPTDDTLAVPGHDWLYAVGDANGRALLTHQGKYQARAAGDAIVARATGRRLDDAPWGAHVATADSVAVPQVVFADPEVATVGLTAAAATEAGYRTRVIDYDLGAVAGSALHEDGYTGQARLVLDEAQDTVLGATFVGPDVAELLHAATIAVVGQVPLARLWHAVPAYPTVSEIWLRLLEGAGR